MSVLVDSNVLLDIFTEDATWFAWSADALDRAALTSPLVINPIIYAEISTRFSRLEELDEILPSNRHATVYSLCFSLSSGKSLQQLSVPRRCANLAASRLSHWCACGGGKVPAVDARSKPIPDVFSPRRSHRPVKRRVSVTAEGRRRKRARRLHNKQALELGL
jgi:hypothetical protein